MIWDNFSIFSTNCAITFATHTRTCCEEVCGCRAGEMASEFQEYFYAFGPQLNTFRSVGILLEYFFLS